MPAYNAEKTLRQTHSEVLAQDCVDLIIVVDDVSHDKTIEVARGLSKTRVYAHESNLGYGGNQKTCYRRALEEGGDIVSSDRGFSGATPSKGVCPCGSM